MSKEQNTFNIKGAYNCAKNNGGRNRGKNGSCIKYIRICSIVLVGWLLATPLQAITLKFSSIAPQNSTWGRTLEKIANSWERISDGEVELRIFHNSVAGNETDVLRKMRVGQIHMGVFTSLGLGNIAPEVLAISAPGLITSNNEVQYVFREIGPELEEIVNDGPFELMGWSVAGWIYPFAKGPIRTPSDLREFTIATTNTNQSLTRLLRLAGFNAVPLDFTEWLTGLNSGLVEGFVASPIAAAGFQWFGIAQYMVDIQLSPFLGAIVISDRAWRQIPRNLRSRLKRVAQQELATLTRESADIDKSAIATMERYGLKRIVPTERERNIWIRELTSNPAIRSEIDTVFDSETYSRIQRLLRGYRAR